MFHKPTEASLLDSVDLIGKSRVQCYVIYEDKDEPMWWQRLLKKGYRHSFLIIFDGFFWIKMEYSIGFMDICVLPFYNNNTIKDIVKGRDYTYQYIEVWRRTRYRTIFAPWTCIEAIKAVLGIRAYTVFTPYQLYKYIEVKHGETRSRAKRRATRSRNKKK